MPAADEQSGLPALAASPADSQTAPRKKQVKKGPTDEEQLTAGMVKVTYEVDDDFDAADGTGVKRTVWIPDFSGMA